MMKILLYCSSVASWWQRSVDLYENRKDTPKKGEKIRKKYKTNAKYIIQKYKTKVQNKKKYTKNIRKT